MCFHILVYNPAILFRRRLHPVNDRTVVLFVTLSPSCGVLPAPETFQIMRQTQAHEGSVFTLCMLQGGAVLSGGGKDRKIIRWSADLAPERECEVKRVFVGVCVFVCVVTAILFRFGLNSVLLFL